MTGLKKDPGFTEEQWGILWDLLYNVTTNNAHVNEAGQIELDEEREDGGMILDPYTLEQIKDMHNMEEGLWHAMGRGER
jgi:hypothetical protein